MALKLSTGLRNDMLGKVAIPKVVYSEGIGTGDLVYVDGGGGIEDSITHSASGFVTAGFAPGDLIYTYGSTTAANNMSGVALTAVTAGTLTFATATVNTGEAFVAATYIVCCKGGSLKDVFKDGVLRIYSGTQPTNADTAFAGTLLLSVTAASGAFVAGAFGNGLEFGTAASGAISKNTEVWSGVAGASGTAGWFRLMANATDASGASTSLQRIDGSIGTSGADLNMSSTTITSGQTYTIDTFTITLPSYYGA